MLYHTVPSLSSPCNNNTDSTINDSKFVNDNNDDVPDDENYDNDDIDIDNDDDDDDEYLTNLALFDHEDSGWRNLARGTLESQSRDFRESVRGLDLQLFLLFLQNVNCSHKIASSKLLFTCQKKDYMNVVCLFSTV